MCEYCENDKTLLSEEVVNGNSMAFCGDIEPKDIWRFEYKIGVFVDRGYLRLVDLDDCQCLDGGEKIAINYCPMCGKEFDNAR